MPNSTYLEELMERRPFGWEFINRTAAPYHFEWEEVDPFYWHDFLETNWTWAFYVGVAYIFTIFGVKWLMKDRPALDLRGPLFWWNLGLGMFSLAGLTRTLPGFLYVMGQENGFYTSICEKKNADVPFGFWVLMFIWSKFFELGDTLFIVLRKRPLVFLQWYHHVVTMVAVWILAPHMEPVTRWYTVLNFGVHSLMYPYFALKAIGIRVPSRVANLITTLQLTQMIIGFGVNMLSLYYHQMGYGCARYPTSIKVFGLVYGSFLILFGKLFYDSVLNQGRAKGDHVKLGKKID